MDERTLKSSEKLYWKEIKKIFEFGGLRDIYIENVDINNWNNLFDLLEDKYNFLLTISNSNIKQNTIDRDLLKNYLNNQSFLDFSLSLSIFLNNIEIVCHFFKDEMEFDFPSSQLSSFQSYKLVENFMINLSSELDKEIILTDESSKEFPLILIDNNRDIFKFRHSDRWRNKSDFLKADG